MTNLALRDPLRMFVNELRLHDVIPTADLEAGLAHLEVEIERVALDAYAAQCRGTPLPEAVHDFTNYPHLARMHTAFDDILTMSLPPQILAWLRSLLSMREPPSFNGMRTAMVVAAADPQHAHLQALARFALFEGVRLNLVMLTKWFPQETIGVGIELGDLDRIAEARIVEWMAEGPVVPAGVRPFHVIVSAAVQALSVHAEELRASLFHLQRDFREAARYRAAIEQAMNEMDVRDAILIRNELAPGLGEQHLSVELLQERHLFVLGDVTRNALDQRIGRARKKSRDALRRRRMALLDVLSGPFALEGVR